MRYPRVRDTLNKLKWDSEELIFVILTVEDRVSGTKKIVGSDIGRLGAREFEVLSDGVSTSWIPYYKVMQIVIGDELIWKRGETVVRK